MAWIDDRVWCHPKLTDISKPAFAGWVKAVCYSTGFQTRGALTNGQLAIIGVTRKERAELVAAGLWADTKDGIEVHDWDDHNSRRDDRRAAERERKQRQRKREREAAGPADVTRDVTSKSRVTECVEGSEGSEELKPKAVLWSRPEMLIKEGRG